MADRGGRRRMALLAVAVSAGLLLTACAPFSRESPHSEIGENAGQVSEALGSIDGVDAGEVGFALNGLPGNYSSTTTLTVSTEGDAVLGEILLQAASIIWNEYGTAAPQYRFAVKAPWPDGLRTHQLVVLGDRQGEFGFTEGKYLGTHLILTTDELSAMFGAAE